ncbi:MAG TPA: hypothetical protein VHD59_12570 [Pseudolabrys sp.]|jgi:hypothetical protein|nr:hypothetical protein [Pseudolabrys sp.]
MEKYKRVSEPQAMVNGICQLEEMLGELFDDLRASVKEMELYVLELKKTILSSSNGNQGLTRQSDSCREPDISILRRAHDCAILHMRVAQELMQPVQEHIGAVMASLDEMTQEIKNPRPQ